MWVRIRDLTSLGIASGEDIGSLHVVEPDDRILLLIGAGHVPIIRHAAQASPEFEVIEVRDVPGE